MNKIIRIDTISDYTGSIGITSLHPQVAVVNFASLPSMEYVMKSYSVYALFLRDNYIGEIRYGMEKYEYEENSLLFVAPGQVIGVSEVKYIPPKGWALLFHPDFLINTSLESRIEKFQFFSYSVNRALRMEKGEHHLIVTFFVFILKELKRGTYRNSHEIIASLIGAVLNYCQRFYYRQFASVAETVQNNVLSRFEQMLFDYFTTGRAQREGIPTATRCAEEMHLSPNYFGILIKEATGKTVKEHIMMWTVARAKFLLATSDKNIKEIAYELGFNYPHHLSRVFKRITGLSPNEYRKQYHL